MAPTFYCGAEARKVGKGCYCKPRLPGGRLHQKLGGVVSLQGLGGGGVPRMKGPSWEGAWSVCEWGVVYQIGAGPR